MHCVTSQPEPKKIRGTLNFSAPEIMRSKLKDLGKLEHPNQLSRDHDQFVIKGDWKTDVWSLALVYFIPFSRVFLAILTSLGISP